MDRISGAIIGLFVVFGLGFLVWGARQAMDTVRFVSVAVSAKGEVVQVLTPFPVSYRWSQARIRFSLPDGEEVQFLTNANSRAYLLGESRPVLYLPEDPASAREDGLFPLWFGPTVLLLLGFSLTLGPPGALALNVWRSRREPVLSARLRQDQATRKR